MAAMNAPVLIPDRLSDGLIAAAREAVRLPAGARIVAAMSGGVDSTVTAALLAKAGYDVVGVTLQLYDHGAAIQKKGACCAGQDIHDARTAAASLSIPHYVLDYESRFKDQVIEEFADAYLRGETPVPCIRCNQTVKFRDLLDVARDLGAEAMATGHYVRRGVGAAGPELHRAADSARDQSYFLFATTAEQLAYLRFPLGGLPKPAVRAAAAELGLAVADKPDSQDICFVPEGRGLNVAVGDPLFVVRIDADSRQVIVGPREALLTHACTLKEVNWLGDGASIEAACAAARPVLARVRSTREPAPGRLAVIDGQPAVVFDAPEEGVAPGQACVLYAPEAPTRVLGGGFIAGTVRAALP